MEQWNSVQLRSREIRPGLKVIGRLKAGVSIEAARVEMAAICSGLARQYPATNAGHGAKVVRMKDDMVQYIRPTLLLLAGAVVRADYPAPTANLLLAPRPKA
jgi:hypothetical protein